MENSQNMYRLRLLLAALVAITTLTHAQTGTNLNSSAPVQYALPTPADGPKDFAPKIEDGMAWYNPTNWGVEGRGWTEGLAHYYDRFPARAEKTIPGDVWNISHESAGISVRFVTDSQSIHVRYRLTSPNLSHGWADFANMTGSGVDLYAESTDLITGKQIWRWVGGNKPVTNNASDCLVSRLAPGKRPYVLNLPVYNGVESMEIGVPVGASFAGVPPRTNLPIVFYGTSIMQGGVASRPGLVIPALVGRRLDCPVINLGFAGSGRMEASVVDLLAEIKAAVYVVDCEPNMVPDSIAQRTEPLVRRLRQAHPETPILLVEYHDSPSPELLPQESAYIRAMQVALMSAYERLVKDGVKNLYYLPGRELIGDDSEGTGDGIHPNALGTFRYAEAYTAALREILH